jgi:hypothetical protein
MLILEVILFPLVLATPIRVFGSGLIKSPFKNILLDELMALQKLTFQTHSVS